MGGAAKTAGSAIGGGFNAGGGSFLDGMQSGSFNPQFNLPAPGGWLGGMGKKIEPGRFDLRGLELDKPYLKGIEKEYNQVGIDKGAILGPKGDLARAVQLGQITPAEAAQIDMAQANQLRGNQVGLIERLQAAEMGQGPSLAQMQLQQATERNLAQQMGLAASMGGGAAGLRQVGLNFANTNQQAAQQSAMARLEEQLQARAQLGAALESARGQDIGLATSQAGLSQQANLANLEARQAAAMRQSELDQANIEARVAARQQLADRRLAIAAEKMGAKERATERSLKKYLGEEDIRLGAFKTREEARAGMIGSGTQAGGSALAAYMMSAAAASDRNLKTNIKDGSKDLRAFLGSIKSEKYSYKDSELPGTGKGQFISPMAQDLEKTKIGKGLVFDTPVGKMVNYARAAGLLLSANSDLHRRLEKLENKKGK